MTTITLERYSHGTRVTGINESNIRQITSYLEKLSLKEPTKDRFGRMVDVLKKKYYGMTKDKKELFIHRNTTENFILFLKEIGYEVGQNVKIKEIKPPLVIQPVDLYVKDYFVPKDYQALCIEDMMKPIYSSRLDLYTGGGKLQPLSSKILTPTGWSTMGEMHVGKEILAPDGTVTKVTGVFPHGRQKIFKITFVDGRSTRAGGEHLWKIFDGRTGPDYGWRVVNTLDLINLMNGPHSKRFHVPLIIPYESDDIELPIDPYTLGVLLGDGGLSGGSIQVTKLDEEVFDRITPTLPDNLEWSGRTTDGKSRVIRFKEGVDKKKETNILKEVLMEHGLMGTRSWEKFIPAVYFKGSANQRRALLQGLMDTDGTCGNTKDRTGGTSSFCSTSYELAKGVQYLVRSLGGIAKIVVKEKFYTHSGVKKLGRVAYQVNIRHKKPSELFSLPRKKDRTNDNNQYAANLRLRIEKVELDDYEEAQCISVAHPDRLYITDDFIVTHNTYCALQVVSNVGERLVVMLQPKYFGLWEKAFDEVYTNGPSIARYVSGSKQLKELIDDGLADNINHEIIVISSVTYRAYIDAYEEHGKHIAKIGYNVPPTRFHEAIAAGIQINDEYQEDPGLAFRVDIFTNIKKQIYLSATPYTGNEYVTKMIDVGLPKETLCRVPDFNKYINVVALMYNDNVSPRDYLTPYKNTYNHARYEKIMMRNKKRYDAYFDKVKRAINGLYLKDKMDGQKLLVLCAFVEFIDKITRDLKKAYPDLVINSHVAGSDFNQLKLNDITVSTIKSAGTGVDIVNLKETLLLQAVGSKKDNIQILGRTRVLKNYPGVDPRLSYMVCMDIPQHLRYHEQKKMDFEGRIKSFRVSRL